MLTWSDLVHSTLNVLQHHVIIPMSVPTYNVAVYDCINVESFLVNVRTKCQNKIFARTFSLAVGRL